MGQGSAGDRYAEGLGPEGFKSGPLEVTAQGVLIPHGEAPNRQMLIQQTLTKDTTSNKTNMGF